MDFEPLRGSISTLSQLEPDELPQIGANEPATQLYFNPPGIVVILFGDGYVRSPIEYDPPSQKGHAMTRPPGQFLNMSGIELGQYEE